MAYYGGLKGILTGLTKSADHPSMIFETSVYSIYNPYSIYFRMAVPEEAGDSVTVYMGS